MTKEIYNGITFYRATNDINGNPRYIIHYLDLAGDYEQASFIAKKLNGKKYRGKNFGGGFIFTTYTPEILSKNIKYFKHLAELNRLN